MFEEERAQLAHEAFAFVEFDGEGGDEGRACVGGGAGEGAVGGALREIGPGEVAEQRTVLGHNRVGGDPGGEWQVRVGEWAEVVKRSEVIVGSAPAYGGA